MRIATILPRKLALLLVALSLILLATVPMFADGSPNIVISQIYGAGGNSGAVLKNDYIELFNRGNTPVDVTGWSLQYTSATGISWGSQKTVLTGVIQPGQYFLVPEQGGTNGTAIPAGDVAGGNFNMAAGAGKLALVSSSTSLTAVTCPTDATIVDLIGYGTTANCAETANITPNLTATTAALRLSNGCTDTNNNSADFVVGAPAPRNSSSPLNSCGGPQLPVGVGHANPTNVDLNSTVLLTVDVTPGQNPVSTGLTVTADLSAIGGSAAQTFFDDGSNGDAAAGDNTFTFTALIPAGTAAGAKALSATVADAEGRSSTSTITFSVNPPPPPVVAIHTIQGAGGKSPYEGQAVSAVGIVTARKTNGFFLQTRDSEVDGDPNTSEGVFVYTGSNVPAVAVVGNEVMASGTIQEYQPSGSSLTMTELSGTISTKLLSTGNALPVSVTLAAGDTNPAGPLDQLQKYESMRVRVDSLTTISGTGGSLSEKNATVTSDGAFWAVITGVERPFREPGLPVGSAFWPLAPANTPLFDNNPERLRVDSDGQAGGTKLDVTSNTLVSDVNGVLDYGSDAYTIDLDPGATPTLAGGMYAAPLRVAGDREFTVASFNMERFYNSTQDDSGAVLLTPTAYDIRLTKASLIVRNVLLMPDIIGVEEVENLATLQDVADRVNNDAVAAGQPNPNYAPYTFQGNDPSAIDVGILVKTGRVDVESVTQVGKDSIYIDPRDGSNDVLNDRPPVVMKATVIPPKGQPFPVTFIVNHLRSMSGYDENTPTGDYARQKRRLQAEFLAQLIQDHQAAGENVISVGDYNVYQFNDGLTDMLGTIMGTPAPADSVLLPSADMVDPNLVDLINTLAPQNRYTYVETGNAQALDHVLITTGLMARPVELEVAHVDSDFPDILHGDPTRPERLSDHDVPVAYFTFPPPQADLAVTVEGATALVSGQTSSYAVTVTNNGPDEAEQVTLLNTVPTGALVDVTAPAGWTCSTTAAQVSCTADVLTNGARSQFAFTVTPVCATTDGTSLFNGIGVTSQTLDVVQSNNTISQTWMVSNPPPVITGLTASKTILWPPNNQLEKVGLSYSVSDNCDTNIIPTVTVSSNEPARDKHHHWSSPDWVVVNNKLVLLRAERDGWNKAGRIYTITVTAKDSAGGSTNQSVTVTVPHDNAHDRWGNRDRDRERDRDRDRDKDKKNNGKSGKK